MVPEIDFLQQTRDAYNKTANTYHCLSTHLHPKISAELFLNKIPKNGLILDVGCGPGRDAKIFSEYGYKITGIDFSSEMIKIAKQTVPKAVFIEGDIQNIDLDDALFDGVWASASLLHIPKNNLKNVLLKIHSALKENGYFYMSVKKGNNEYFGHDNRYTEHEIYKFWSFYQQVEIAKIINESGFDIEHLNVTEHTTPFICLHAKKR